MIKILLSVLFLTLIGCSNTKTKCLGIFEKACSKCFQTETSIETCLQEASRLEFCENIPKINQIMYLDCLNKINDVSCENSIVILSESCSQIGVW